MIDLKDRWQSVSDRETWAARGASIVAKAKATKAVWFPPAPVEAGRKAFSSAGDATKKTARKTGGATKRTAATAKKTGGAAKKTSAARKGSAAKKSSAAKTGTRSRKVTSPADRRQA